ncbi:hypothetical protein O181_017314 [Austropuccinia psidii MF-1]|uniref:Uncharacterized protein n=1 Tax=Austropuccinia psidii MF-1 TaxID=1389203 RepID=A0A9Q3C386_9BASI|nr:hypothetical protein [Austropuccinia psidii MF-1]
MKNNNKHSPELHKSTIAKLELISNTCDRIESKYQVKDDEMEDLSTTNIDDQLKILKNHVLTVVDNGNQFAIHLARSESERQKLKDEILANVEQIHKSYEPNPHMPRHSTSFTEENLSVKGILNPFLGENAISAKDITKLEEWKTLFGEGEYNHIEFIRTIDMLQEDFNIPDEIIVELITKWDNNSWRFKIENAFESAIFNSEKDKPLTWFLKQKDRLSALHPNMSGSIINMKILRKCGGELKYFIKCRCVEPCSSEDYINTMEDIITRTRIGKTWNRTPIASKMVPKICRDDKRPEKPVLKCHKCRSTSHSANTCTKKTKINEVQIIKEVQYTEEKEESGQDSAVSEETPIQDYSIENITAFFEVTEVHSYSPKYSEGCYNLINIQDSRMCKNKLARGKGYTSVASCIKSVLINDVEAKVNLDTGAFCTCIAKYYLQIILPECKNHMLSIEGVQFSSTSNNMYTLGILETSIVFPHPAGSVRMKTEIVIMDNCTSQHIILGNNYLNIYGIDIKNHKER